MSRNFQFTSYTPVVVAKEVRRILISEEFRLTKIGAVGLGVLEGALAIEPSGTRKEESHETATRQVAGSDKVAVTILANPLGRALAHYGEVLDDLLSDCGIATVTRYGGVGSSGSNSPLPLGAS